MKKHKIENLNELILHIPLLLWVMIAYSISYLYLFVSPIFFSSQVMQFPKYVPAIDPIGIDLVQMLSYSKTWFIANHSPYIGANLYPPFASVIFTPLLYMKFSLAYKIMTISSFVFYSIMTIVLPIQICRKKEMSALLIFIFITGLFSYGFQFEIERGQFNLIAMFLCFLSIWIFHYKSKYRYLAYSLFIISVQLKVYPLIFIIIFISDWKDWKRNITRLFALLLMNFAMLFILGSSVFVDFIGAIKAQISNPYIWVGNHSIRSFVSLISKVAMDHGLVDIYEFSRFIQLAILVFVTCCILIIANKAYQGNKKGIDSNLLFACTIGTLLIPSVSHDYKLSILSSSVSILLLDLFTYAEKLKSDNKRLLLILMIFVLTCLYSFTLYSFTVKPLLLSNNCPILLMMLLVNICLAFINKSSLDRTAFEK